MALTPLVSVVIPTYNRSLEIVRCLSSLVSQTFREFEVLVCDDGSTDNTQEVVNTFAGSLNIKYFWLTNFGGPARPRNVGIQNANGKYIAFLDSDDWWTPEKLEVCVQQLENGFDICSHDLWLVKSQNQYFLRRKLRSRSVFTPAYDDLLYNGNGLLNSSVVVKTDILRKIGGQSEDPKLIAAEDYECWLRVAQQTDKFIYISKVLGYYWIGSDNITNPQRSLIFLNQLRYLYIDKYTIDNQTKPPLWWIYALSKANFLIGNNKECKRLLFQALLRSTNPVTTIKCLYMLSIVLTTRLLHTPRSLKKLR
jgi:glycosyltransferase involved in cell wall biosynthesis